MNSELLSPVNCTRSEQIPVRLWEFICPEDPVPLSALFSRASRALSSCPSTLPSFLHTSPAIHAQVEYFQLT